MFFGSRKSSLYMVVFHTHVAHTKTKYNIMKYKKGKNSQKKTIVYLGVSWNSIVGPDNVVPTLFLDPHPPLR